MILENSYLISVSKEPVLCEINNLFFCYKAVFANRKEYKNIPLIQISYYDRLIAPIRTGQAWLFIGKILQRNFNALGGSINLDKKWIEAKNANLLNKYQAHQKTRIISSKFFKDFSKKLSKSFGKHFFCLTHNPEKKAIIYDRLRRFRSLPIINRLEMAEDILNILENYTSKRLNLLTNYIKDLNGIFYNSKEISQGYLSILNNEAIQISKRVKAFDNDLLKLTPDFEKFAMSFTENSDSIKDYNSYINQYKIIKKQISQAKSDYKNGYGFFDYKNQIKIFKQQLNNLKKQQKSEKKDSRRILKSWIKGLKSEKRINKFEIFLEFRKYQQIFLKIKVAKIKCTLKIAKKFLDFKYLKPKDINLAINKISDIVDESFFKYKDYFSLIKKNIKIESKNLISKNIWKDFLKNQKQNIFYWNKKANEILLEYGTINLNFHSKNIDDLNKVKCLINEYRNYGHQIKSNHFNLIKKNLHSKQQKFLVLFCYKKNKNLKNSLLIFLKEQMAFFNKLSNHSFKVSYKSKNITVSTTAYGKNFMYKEITNLYKKYIEINKKNKNISLNSSLFFYKNYFDFIVRKILNRYQSEYDNAELELTNRINFPRTQNDFKDTVRKIKSNFKNIFFKGFDWNKYFEKLNIQKNQNESKINYVNDISYNYYFKFEKNSNYLNNLIERYQNKKKYKKFLSNKIRKINKEFYKNWKLKKNERKFKFKKFKQSFSNFCKFSNHLLKNIKNVNKFCIKTNMVCNSKNPIDNSAFLKLYKSNYAILKRLWWYFWALKSFTFLKSFIQRKNCYKHLSSYDLSQILKQTGLNELILYSNSNSFSADQLLRLYFVCQFTVNPKIFIYLNLPLTTKNQYNFVKGLLLKEQNRTGSALIFLESSGEIARDLGMKFLPTF